jgi:hypothetical protein
MKTYVFFRGETCIGIIVCPEGMALTPEHVMRVTRAGIEVIQKDGQVPLHDGDVNRLVDTLLEKDWL